MKPMLLRMAFAAVLIAAFAAPAGHAEATPARSASTLAIGIPPDWACAWLGICPDGSPH